MTDYVYTGSAPDYGSFEGFDHVHWIVGNAKLMADWYVTRMGFTRVAFRGLETGSRALASHVVRQGRVTFVLTSALVDNDSARLLGSDVGAHLRAHGDGVKDIAFSVTDARAVYAYAVARGARSVAEPVESRDEDGAVVTATVATYGETTHTFVQRSVRGGAPYGGAFLPGYARAPAAADGAALALLPAVGLDFIDHCVGNMPAAGMEPAVAWYEQMLSFHRFWSVDDTQMSTEHSALRSIVVADHDERVKMPINEPAPGKRKSQIQEFCDYYAGAGVQHIALNTRDIVGAITALRARGVGFLRVPDTYYDALEKRLAGAPFTVKEDLATIRKLNILVDMDEKG
jgi:4-hydroxyphenylpyruvate dioxygenase